MGCSELLYSIKATPCSGPRAPALRPPPAPVCAPLAVGPASPGAQQPYLDALRREVAEETGLTVASIGDYLGHFDYHSGSGRSTRQFNFTATVTENEGTVKLTEHDARIWADKDQQAQVSSAIQAVLATCHRSRPA
ncbi:NUDIX hydrolase [Streptomyces coeruleoprunus]|uniref:NUDIX hydrolase n=1 Tax=Streptomyces coeruleoprunus TaxID=285563 RepID=A0ABV9XJH8_9ACTN